MATKTPDLFDAPLPAIPDRPVFDGADYIKSRDDARLTGQLRRIWDFMKDEEWRTLDAIAAATGDPHASISAQLRHLRKPRFGGHSVDRRHKGNGLYEYRVIPNQGEKP